MSPSYFGTPRAAKGMQIPGGLVCRLNGELVRQLGDCTQSVCYVSMTTRTIVPASTIPSIMLFTFWMLIVKISPPRMPPP
jgi:hypothetical protein